MRNPLRSWRKHGFLCLALLSSCSSSTKTSGPDAGPSDVDTSTVTADVTPVADDTAPPPDTRSPRADAVDARTADAPPTPADVRVPTDVADAPLRPDAAPAVDGAAPDTTVVPPPAQLCAQRKQELATAVCPGNDADCAIGCTYFISAQGSDGADGKTAATAWQSLAKLQNLKLASGNTVCLRRGDTFRGGVQLAYGLHASASTPIVFRGYGPATAARPIVSGSKLIPAGWKASALAPQIMQVSLAGTLTVGAAYQRGGKSYTPREKLFQLFVGGQPQRLATFPNPGEGDSVVKGLALPGGHYSLIDSAPAGNQMRDAQLPATNGLSGAAINWTGARFFYRQIRWIMDAMDVTAFDAGTHTLTLDRSPECASDNCVGWGYFLVDHLGALDAPGEWYYDDGTQILYFYPPAGVDPNTAVIEASLYTADAQPPSWASASTLPQPAFTVGLDLQSDSGIRIAGIVFQHFSRAGVLGSATLASDSSDAPDSTTGIAVDGCAFNFTGPTGVDLERWGNIDAADGNNRISGTAFLGQTSQAIILQTTRSEIACNTVDDIGLLEQFPRFGMFGNGQVFTEHGMAVLVTAGGANIVYNRVRRTASAGISFRGPATTVANNFVRHACYTKSDCGGIHTYTWNDSTQFSAPSIAGSAVLGNLIIESLGSSEGDGRGYDTPMAQGMFLDYGARDYTVKGNVLALNTSTGILLARNRNVTVDGNLLYANVQNNDMSYLYGQLQMETDYPPVSATISNNTIAAVAPLQIPMGIRGVTMAQAGTFANTAFFDPFAYDATSSNNSLMNYLVFVATGTVPVGYYLREWKQVSGDSKATATDLYWQADQVTRELSDNLIANGTFDTNTSGWTTNSWSASKLAADVHPVLGPSLRYDRNGAEGGGIGAFSNTFALAAGQTYRVHLWIAPADGVTVPLPPAVNAGNVDDVTFLPDDKVREVSFLLHPTTAQSKAQLEFTAYPLYPDRFWIDDVSVKQVEAQPYDQGIVIRFDQPVPAGVRSFLAYNDTDADQTLALGSGAYVDLGGGSHTGTIAVPAFGAVVLIPDAWAHNPVKVK
jgi:hypothetical protein